MKPTFPKVTFYVQDHSKGGTVGVFQSPHGSLGELQGLSGRAGMGETGKCQHALRYRFDPELSTDGEDVYQMNCKIPVEAGFREVEVEARYRGTNLEVWRDATIVMGIRPSASD